MKGKAFLVFVLFLISEWINYLSPYSRLSRVPCPVLLPASIKPASIKETENNRYMTENVWSGSRLRTVSTNRSTRRSTSVTEAVSTGECI